NKGKVPTEMELVLEQTQQGTSYEVSVSAEGVKELKRKVKIKGEKKEALLTLRQKPEHQSDTQVITVNMEILLESTSNKLMVERFDTSARNPVKKILLKLNLPDHKSILTDSKMDVKMILQRFIDSLWLEHSQQICQNAHSVESIELLKESDWKAVKPEIMKWFSMSNPSFNTGDIETQTNNGFPSTVFFNVTIGPVNGEVSLLGTTETVDYPIDTWGDILVEARNNQEIRLNNLETTQLIRLSSVHLSLKLKEDNVLDGQMMEIYVVVYIFQVLDASIDFGKGEEWGGDEVI
ncbi:hypothetical protein Tco_0567259, partial [Tanacetum coccineum]